MVKHKYCRTFLYYINKFHRAKFVKTVKWWSYKVISQ
jgi:hypothetical protein